MGPQVWARGRGSRRRGRARRYLSASAVAVAPRPAGRAGRPGLLQQRGVGPHSGSRSRSSSGARSSIRSRVTGLRMLGAGRSRRAGARLARLVESPRPALTPPESRGGPGAHCAAAAGRALTSQRGEGKGPAARSSLCGSGLRCSTTAALCGRFRVFRPLPAGPANSHGCGDKRAREGRRAKSTLWGAVLLPPARSRPAVAMVMHGRPPPLRFCYVTVSPPDVTAGRWRGAWSAQRLIDFGGERLDAGRVVSGCESTLGRWASGVDGLRSVLISGDVSEEQSTGCVRRGSPKAAGLAGILLGRLAELRLAT